MRRWLLAIVAIAFVAPAFGQDSGEMRSIFLVARKDLPDPFFRDSVVLVTHRGNAAPVGVIVNRPTKAPLSRAVPDLAESPAKARTVFFGGPVSPETLVVLFRATRKPDNAIEILEGIYMSSHPEVVREVLTGEKLPTDLRIFAGHASWYPGQLENEVGRGDWQLIRADAETIFDEKPEDLWRRLDRRASTKILRAVP